MFINYIAQIIFNALVRLSRTIAALIKGKQNYSQWFRRLLLFIYLLNY